ncbi:interferon-inducible protein AIM2 [Betta splendens]|uniref:Interferon-inducible protein AIM2 n=1 Tax=Betta splendens TaxID=158456 RepID=A0A6P7MWE3_BETSP|nr:interferon-inducible protein AIM2 [Betta splendens]
MLIPELLLNTLDDLSDDDFKRFRWYLTVGVMDSCKRMATSSVEKASRCEVVDKMIRSYGEASAVSLTAEILKNMHMMALAQTLMDAYAAERQSAPSSSSSSSSSSAAAPPPASASVIAQHGSVVVAPNIIGTTAGALNITINKTGFVDD